MGIPRPGTWYSFRVYWLIFAVLLACSPKTSQVKLPVETPESFSSSGTSVIADRWWHSFAEPSLNALIDTALNNNFNLQSIWYRFRAAQAVVDRESSSLFPQVDANAQANVNFPEPDFVGGENFRVGLSAVYELDLWGRIRSRIEAEEYRELATWWDYRTAAMSLSSEITLTWFRVIATSYLLDLSEEQLQTNERILRLILARYSSGQVRGVDILRQKQLLESTRGQKIQSEAQFHLFEHQLAVLKGEAPPYGEVNRPDSLPVLPPLPDTGIPVELIERRPDVQSAFSRLKAADREVASAISNKYPRLTFNASIQQRANRPSDLFNAWAYSFGANLIAPLFYGGRLNAEVKRTEAVKMQLLYDYGQQVLIAFREVEDALIQEQKQREAIEVLEEQVNLAQQTNKQLRNQYFNGLIDYLDVLTSINQEQQLRRDLVSAKLLLLEYRVALYRALAGSFETEREQDIEQKKAGDPLQEQLENNNDS